MPYSAPSRSADPPCGSPKPSPTTTSMTPPRPLTDREMFSARPWRAPNRTQVIVAVVENEAEEPRWHLVLATLHGSRVYSKPLEFARTPRSFSEDELQAFYDEATLAIAS